MLLTVGVIVILFALAVISAGLYIGNKDMKLEEERATEEEDNRVEEKPENKIVNAGGDIFGNEEKVNHNKPMEKESIVEKLEQPIIEELETPSMTPEPQEVDNTEANANVLNEDVSTAIDMTNESEDIEPNLNVEEHIEDLNNESPHYDYEPEHTMSIAVDAIENSDDPLAEFDTNTSLEMNTEEIDPVGVDLPTPEDTSSEKEEGNRVGDEKEESSNPFAKNRKEIDGDNVINITGKQ